jgi:hypothetical protein
LERDDPANGADREPPLPRRPGSWSTSRLLAGSRLWLRAGTVGWLPLVLVFAVGLAGGGYAWNAWNAGRADQRAQSELQLVARVAQVDANSDYGAGPDTVVIVIVSVSPQPVQVTSVRGSAHGVELTPAAAGSALRLEPRTSATVTLTVSVDCARADGAGWLSQLDIDAVTADGRAQHLTVQLDDVHTLNNFVNGRCELTDEPLVASDVDEITKVTVAGRPALRARIVFVRVRSALNGLDQLSARSLSDGFTVTSQASAASPQPTQTPVPTPSGTATNDRRPAFLLSTTWTVRDCAVAVKARLIDLRLVATARTATGAQSVLITVPSELGLELVRFALDQCRAGA